MADDIEQKDGEPKENGKDGRVRINIFLSPEWHKDLIEIGKVEDMNISEIVRDSVRQYLRNYRLRKLGPVVDYMSPVAADNAVSKMEADKKAEAQ